MKRTTLAVIIITMFFSVVSMNAQKPKRDKGKMIEYKNEFWDQIKKSAEEFKKEQNKKEEPKSFKMDFTGYDLPKSIKEFKYQWHNPPISQGWTGTCWCFSTTSFLESEVKRLYGKEMKFSEMFTVYWEYVEKARRFVRERGNSVFDEGSEANAVTRIWEKYGCVPEDSYTGLLPGQKFYDHTGLIKDMKTYLKNVKETNAWNEDVVLTTIKNILNQYMGVPPQKITYMGKEMTPMEFLKNEVKIHPDDYVNIMSLFEKPYWQKVLYDVPDNWWRSKEYYNVPLDDFMDALLKAAKNGYTMFIGGDVSSTGLDSHSEVAMIPSYDIPSDYIDEYARQLRFSNKTTTDDHGIHLVGYTQKAGRYWFLIKDSGSGARNGANKGYYFYDGDYVKLKMMNFMIHKSAVEELLKKFEKN